MKTYEEQIDAGLAYARAALTARLGEVKGETEREQDAALALAIVALVAAQRNERARLGRLSVHAFCARGRAIVASSIARRLASRCIAASSAPLVSFLFLTHFDAVFSRVCAVERGFS